MSIDRLREMLPEYAKDLRLNLSSLIANPEGMTDQQLWGTFVASACAAGEPTVIAAAIEQARAHISDEAVTAAKAAAAIMSMNNVYYRFVHLAGNKDYSQMPAKLRMNVIANPGVDKQDFELWSLAVSAINGCGMCIDSHERQLVKAGLAKETIQHAVRIAAVVRAVAATLAAEAAAQSYTAN
ncbi:MAG TPA: carboxymuconolactone decarboxylase family protein [Candidatus Sumerlaeota bacterium]|nr:MAG: Alkyl hydroperoxide reductase AhpD [candidate division BRC1 bacterium ADurb.BinA292]HPK02539.1 carboxymuconolactone decarboxylase family protein [Candidatus Sumerlaeota bacterium]